MKKIILAIASFFVVVGYAHADVSFDCQAGYQCGFTVAYIDKDKAVHLWDSGGYPVAQRKIFKMNSADTIIEVKPYWIAFGSHTIKSYTQFTQGKNYDGKMWGTVFSPQSCLTINGQGCI